VTRLCGEAEAGVTGAGGTGKPVPYEVPGHFVGAICDRPFAAGCVPCVAGGAWPRPYKSLGLAT